MSDPIALVEKRIAERHGDDEEQLAVIFSKSRRLLVEAPAGYGKTNTMVSRIAYMIATRQIPNPKKLLALTFSVNAAYKIKRDVIAEVPSLLDGTGLEFRTSEKVFVSNYHGFCRSALRRCGSTVHPALLDIQTLEPFDDSDQSKLLRAFGEMTPRVARFASEFAQSVREKRGRFIFDNLDDYCSIVKDFYLPNEKVSFNGILALTIQLLNQQPKVAEFYQAYFRTVIVDEFQDTNWLSFWLLTKLVGENNGLILLGDSLQRIYGFIGAVPEVLAKSTDRFGMEVIQLARNYRFANNSEMLQLDDNLRQIAASPRAPRISAVSNVELNASDNQYEEAAWLAARAGELVAGDSSTRVAILVKQRGPNIDLITDELYRKEIPYFWGLFTDEDAKYVDFHRSCLQEFLDLLRAYGTVGRKLGNEHLKRVRDKFPDVHDALTNSLTTLLEVFWKLIWSSLGYLSNEDKITLVRDTFAYNGLKQYIESVDANVVVSTVHAAKGLEWDYVILPDMEQDSFPNWFGLCNSCRFRSGCALVVDDENEVRFLEELSVFYVAVTRAKRAVMFSWSKTAPDRNGQARAKNLSCLLQLPGLVTQSQK